MTNTWLLPSIDEGRSGPKRSITGIMKRDYAIPFSNSILTDGGMIKEKKQFTLLGALFRSFYIIFWYSLTSFASNIYLVYVTLCVGKKGGPLMGSRDTLQVSSVVRRA